MDLQFPKPYQIVKRAKCCVSKLLIWSQKWVAGVLLVVRRGSPDRIILLCYFEQKLLFLVRLKPEFSRLPLDEVIAMSLFSLAVKK